MSERFVSLQGEGVTAGAPAAFLRLARCNLACGFCDTPYSWDFQRYSFDQEVERVSVEELCGWIRREAPGRLILTGGEPLLQQKALRQLLLAAEKEAPLPTVEVETNGTIVPDPLLSERIAQWNVSVKLRNSGEAERRRLRPGAIAWFARHPAAFFKFVVKDAADQSEALELARRYRVPLTRVLFMPLSATPAELAERSSEVAQLALASGVRFSSRLHLQLFEGRRGA